MVRGKEKEKLLLVCTCWVVVVDDDANVAAAADLLYSDHSSVDTWRCQTSLQLEAKCSQNYTMRNWSCHPESLRALTKQATRIGEMLLDAMPPAATHGIYS